jgi:hypothetical protein
VSDDLAAYESIFPTLAQSSAHIDALTDEGLAWLETGVEVLQEHNLETGEGRCFVHLAEPPPARLGLLMADAVHNLRVTLDHVAFFLASKNYETLHQGQPLPKSAANDSAFPMLGGSSEDGRFTTVRSKQLKWVENGAQDAIERLQPYQLGEDYKSDPLWVINNLDNGAKHRSPTVAALKVRKQNTMVSRAKIHYIHDLHRGWVVAEDGTDLVMFRVEVGPHSALNIDFNSDLALKDAPEVAQGPIVAVLRDLHDHVRTTVLPVLGPYLL